MPKTVAPHVASAIALLGAILSALHPGFSVNSSLSQWATVILLVTGGVIQTITAFFHANNAGKFVIVKALTEKVIADFESGKVSVTVPSTTAPIPGNLA